MNRYSDASKLIKNIDDIKLEKNHQIVIFSGDKFLNDVVLEVGNLEDEFDKVRPFLFFIAQHFYRMDDIASEYSAVHGERQFVYKYEIAAISIDYEGLLHILYFGMTENTEFEVVFQFDKDEFVLKKFGMAENIPKNWRDC